MTKSDPLMNGTTTHQWISHLSQTLVQKTKMQHFCL